jgi:hypothetical protein
VRAGKAASLSALVLALLIGGCGQDAESPGQAGALERALKDELREENREEGAFSQVLALRCKEQAATSDYDCRGSVRARAFVFRDRYRVKLGADGCFRAQRVELEVLRGGGLDAKELPPGELRGCLG